MIAVHLRDLDSVISAFGGRWLGMAQIIDIDSEPARLTTKDIKAYLERNNIRINWELAENDRDYAGDVIDRLRGYVHGQTDDMEGSIPSTGLPYTIDRLIARPDLRLGASVTAAVHKRDSEGRLTLEVEALAGWTFAGIAATGEIIVRPPESIEVPRLQPQFMPVEVLELYNPPPGQIGI